MMTFSLLFLLALKKIGKYIGRCNIYTASIHRQNNGNSYSKQVYGKIAICFDVNKN